MSDLKKEGVEFKQHLPPELQFKFQLWTEQVFFESAEEFANISATVPAKLKKLVEGALRPATAIMGKPRKGDMSNFIASLFEKWLVEFYEVPSYVLLSLVAETGSYDKEVLKAAVEQYKDMQKIELPDNIEQ